MFSVDLGEALVVTCTKCGAERELPEPDGTPRMPATSPDGATTLQADAPCRCGAKRVKVQLVLEPQGAAAGTDEPGE